jgi:hypothetical protein
MLASSIRRSLSLNVGVSWERSLVGASIYRIFYFDSTGTLTSMKLEDIATDP